MEIIHVVLGKANPNRMNGVNKVVHQLATQQHQAGKAVAVWGFTQHPVHDYPPRCYRTVLFCTYRNRVKLDAAFVAQLGASQAKRVFHLHGGFNPLMSIVAQQLNRHGLPYVFTPHGAYNTIALRKGWLRKRLFFALWEKKMLRHAHAVHSLGASEVAGLARLYPGAKSVLIPYGFEGYSGIAASYAQQNFVIGFCGRIDIYTKGLDVLAEAFAQFRQLVPNSVLWMVGGGGETDALKALLQKRNLLAHTHLWGSQFGNDKLQIMQQMTVFVHPSRNEGLPTAVLEAASLGLPCIVTEATNMASYVQQYGAGLSIESCNASLLCRAFLQAYHWQQTQQLPSVAAQARAMVQQAFNWQQIVQDFDKLYPAL